MVNIHSVVNMSFLLTASFTDFASNNSFLIWYIVLYETRGGPYPVWAIKLIGYNWKVCRFNCSTGKHRAQRYKRTPTIIKSWVIQWRKKKHLFGFCKNPMPLKQEYRRVGIKWIKEVRQTHRWTYTLCFSLGKSTVAWRLCPGTECLKAGTHQAKADYWQWWREPSGVCHHCWRKMWTWMQRNSGGKTTN